MLRILAIVILASSAPILPAGAEDNKPTPPIKLAVERSLALIQKSLTEYPRHATCFSCHHQGMGLFTVSLARSNGYASAVDSKVVDSVIQHTTADLKTGVEAYRKGNGQPGGVTRAGYALFALQSGETRRDDITYAVTGYLLGHQKTQAFWHSPSNRPPSENSAFTDTLLAIRALKTFGDDTQKDAIKQRLDQARTWLEQTSTKDTEDRVFRLWGLAEAGADSTLIQKAAQELMKEQREDGGWSQLPGADSKSPGGTSDAYATGSVLTVLRLAGKLSPEDANFKRGIQFLLRTQLPDGSWHVVSRSKPFQPYFESGFPHGMDQFISMAATGWAASALILAESPGNSRRALRQ